jgi:hypothetical protein
MQRLFGQVDLAQRRVLIEKALHVEPLPKVQAVAVAQKQTANGHRTPVAGDFDATLGQGGVEQPQDMKLVGDQASVGESASREALVGIAHVERDQANVVAPLDVRQRRLELLDGSSVHQLEEASTSDVDDHRDKVAWMQRLSAAKRVLV